MTSLNFRRQPDPLLSEAAQTFGLSEARASTPEEPRGYACLRASGSDTASFLQGQMTADIAALAVGRCQTSALCNPKGRVIAQIEIARLGDDTFALILPGHLTTDVTSTLTRYILRSRVTLDAWPGQSRIILRRSEDAPESGHCRLDVNGWLSCRPGWLPAGEPSWELSNAGLAVDPATDARDRSWDLAHVLLGLAPPVAATALEHIPQMLNLDRLDAISLTKGCYTGQEIIARVHHRGAVKRRLRRFVLDASASVAPGDTLKTATGARAGMVVVVARDDHDQLGLLAVVKESDYSPVAQLFCQGLPLDHWPFTRR